MFICSTGQYVNCFVAVVCFQIIGDHIKTLIHSRACPYIHMAPAISTIFIINIYLLKS